MFLIYVRLLETAFLVFIERRIMKTLWATSVALIALIVMRECEPFIKVSDDQVAHFGQWTVFAWLFAFQAFDALSSQEGWVWGTPLMLLTLGFVIFAIVKSLKDIRDVQEARRRAAIAGGEDEAPARVAGRRSTRRSGTFPREFLPEEPERVVLGDFGTFINDAKFRTRLQKMHTLAAQVVGEPQLHDEAKVTERREQPETSPGDEDQISGASAGVDDEKPTGDVAGVDEEKSTGGVAGVGEAKTQPPDAGENVKPEVDGNDDEIQPMAEALQTISDLCERADRWRHLRLELIVKPEDIPMTTVRLFCRSVN